MKNQKVHRVCRVCGEKKELFAFRPYRKACRKCCYELGSAKVKAWKDKRHDYHLEWQKQYRAKHPLMRKLVAIRREGVSVKGFLQLLEKMYADRPYCEYCKISLRAEDVSLDHKVPISRGGDRANPDNWAISCHDCNYLKRMRTCDEFKVFVIDYVKRFLVNTEPSRIKEDAEGVTVSPGITDTSAPALIEA